MNCHSEQPCTFKELAQIIIAGTPKNNRRLIAIDGGGGAGKTTFSNFLQKAIHNSYVVRVDDFYRPPQLRKPFEKTKCINPNIDWDRLQSSVFEAVKNDSDIVYQLYDFKKGNLSGKFIEVPRSASVIIVEGVWSMQADFIDNYDYCIWLDASPEVRLERGISRDGEDLRKVWENEWIPIDETYKREQKPYLKANCVVDSSRSNFAGDRIVTSQDFF